MHDVATMSSEIPAHRAGTLEHRHSIVAACRGESLGQVLDPDRVQGHRPDVGDGDGQRRRLRLEPAQQCAETLAQLFDRYHVIGRGGRHVRQRVEATAQRIRGSGPAGRLPQRTVDAALEGGTHGEQVTRKVATVDGRHVARLERQQRSGVVPVQEVSVEAGQPIECLHRLRDAGDEITEPEPAEVPRRHTGQQIQAEVRW